MPPENGDWHNRVGEWGCGFGKENRVMIENIKQQIGTLASSERVNTLQETVKGHGEKLDRIQLLVVTNLATVLGTVTVGILWLIINGSLGKP